MSSIKIKDKNGLKVVEKEVENIEVYYQLKLYDFDITPKILEVDDNNNTIIYEYIEGKSLYEILKEDRLSLLERIDIALELINALSLINKHNIIHKDIKPENIIYSNDSKLYLIDFGASRLFDGSKSRDTVLLGTQNYASPEHYGYKETTYKSDMYSLGCVLKDLRLGSSFDHIIDKCMQINPSDRYDSYNDILNEANKVIVEVSKRITQQKENEIRELIKREKEALKSSKEINSSWKREVKQAQKNLDKVENRDIEKVFEDNNKPINQSGFKSLFIKWRYNFDNSKIQWILTIIIFLAVLLIDDKSTQSNYSVGVDISVQIYGAFLLCYIADSIRITFKRIFNKNIKLLRYYLIYMINVVIGFIIYMLLALIIDAFI